MLRSIATAALVTGGVSYGSYKVTQSYVFRNHESYKSFCNKVPTFMSNTRLYDNFMETGSYNSLMNSTYSTILSPNRDNRYISDFLYHIKTDDKLANIVLKHPYYFGFINKDIHNHVLEFLITNHKLSISDQQRLFTYIGAVNAPIILTGTLFNRLLPDLLFGTYNRYKYSDTHNDSDIHDDSDIHNDSDIYFTFYCNSHAFIPAQINMTHVRTVTITPDTFVHLLHPSTNSMSINIPNAKANVNDLVLGPYTKLTHQLQPSP